MKSFEGCPVLKILEFLAHILPLHPAVNKLAVSLKRKSLFLLRENLRFFKLQPENGLKYKVKLGPLGPKPLFYVFYDEKILIYY